MIKITQLIEDAILGKIIAAMLDAGYRIEISDQDGGGLMIYGSADDADKLAGYAYWVRLTPGNGVGIIADYSMNLDPVLAPVNAFAQSIEV